MTGTLGRYHNNVHVGGRHDLSEMNVETVGEGNRFSRCKVGSDALPVHVRLTLVVNKYHYYIRRLGRIGRGHYGKACLFRLCPGFAPAVKSDNYVNAAVLKI